jgi:hypothetical protein
MRPDIRSAALGFAMRRRQTVILALVLVFAFSGSAFAVARGTPFSLGVSNSIDYLTTLVGSAARMLQVTNTSSSGTSFGLGVRAQGGTPLQLVGPASKPPMTVNSGLRVTNLNADRVDGYHANELARASSGRTADCSEAVNPCLLTDTPSVRADVKLTVPRSGFVLVNATTIVARYGGSCPCNGTMRVVDPLTGAGSKLITTELDNYANLASTYLFPVTVAAPTERTFSIEAYKSAGAAGTLVMEGDITAVFVPFGPAGD